MARRSSGRPASRASVRNPVRNPPQKAYHAPPPAHVPAQGGGILSGIGSTIAQGMAFGTGSAVAHRAVDAVLGPRSIQHEAVVSDAVSMPNAATTNALSGADSCKTHYKAFEHCLNNNGSDIGQCQFYLDMLSECRRSSDSVMGA